MNIHIRPTKEIFKKFFIISTVLGVLVFISLIPLDGIKEGNLIVSLIIFGISLATFLLVVTPSILFESIEIKNNRIIYLFWKFQKKLTIEEIVSVREIHRYRSRNILQINTETEKIEIKYMLYKKEDIKKLIKALLIRNSNIINEFDVIK